MKAVRRVVGVWESKEKLSVLFPLPRFKKKGPLARVQSVSQAVSRRLLRRVQFVEIGESPFRQKGKYGAFLPQSESRKSHDVERLRRTIGQSRGGECSISCDLFNGGDRRFSRTKGTRKINFENAHGMENTGEKNLYNALKDYQVFTVFRVSDAPSRLVCKKTSNQASSNKPKQQQASLFYHLCPLLLSLSLVCRCSLLIAAAASSAVKPTLFGEPRRFEAREQERSERDRERRLLD